MIIRRLADALKKQQWFQVIVEILIVIVGIFLGLQVQEWNEARQDRAAGALYLSQITADLKYDLAVTQQILDQAISLKQSQLFRVEQLIERGEPLETLIANENLVVNRPFFPTEQVEIDSFRSLEYSTIFSWSYPLIRSTAFDDLQNNGKLTLIADDRLRFLISDYYDQSLNANNRVIQRVTGYGDALYTLVDAGARTAFTHSSQSGRTRLDQPGFDPGVSIEEFVDRARDEEFLKLLRAEKNYTAFIYDMTQEQLDRTNALLAIIEGEAE
jgi:hypothetical protein